MPDNLELTKAEQDEVHSHIHGFMDILNKKDARAIASHFDTHAVFVGAAGMSVGRDAIQKRFEHNFQRRFKGATMKLQGLENFAKVGAGAVAGGGNCFAGGIIKEDGQKVEGLRSNLVMTLVKKNGQWLFSALAIVNETAAGR
jgi:ketosteroid isomerase-like protein